MKKDPLSIPFWSTEEVEAAIGPALEFLDARRVLVYIN